MRGYEKIPRRLNRVPALLALATVGLLLALACPAAIAPPAQAGPAAATKPSGDPVRFWSVSKIEQAVGNVLVTRGAQAGGVLDKTVDLGPTSLHPRGLSDRAVQEVNSSADGATYFVTATAPSLDSSNPRSPKGAVTHLDEYQAYEKRSGDASLRITISNVFLDAIDANGDLPRAVCPAKRCRPIRTVVRFHARAYAASAGGDFFDVGGTVYIEGHIGAWSVRAVTASDAQAPVWNDSSFDIDEDFDDDGGNRAVVRLHQVDVPGPFSPVTRPVRLTVPLGSVRLGELFAVHVSMDAEAINDRGGESYARAFIQDPQHGNAALLTARGLKSRGAPKFKEPPIRPRPAASCPAGSPRHAGTVQLSTPAFTVGEGSGSPFVLVTREGGSRGATSVMVNTSGGTARSGVDFKRTKTLVRFENGDSSPRLVEIPIREDLTRESPESFEVSLAHVRCSALGKQRSASVTILDDDQPPPPPPPAFTIGGTVDGLQGSGLVLSDFGAAVPVSANGSFTFPGTVSDSQDYEVNVATQPTNPDQICTVDHGSGQLASANVNNIAVHCVTQVIPSGLDSTFGDGGRVTAPGAGEGRAVLIQPGGGIVTVGEREVAGTGHTQFGATRHDDAGHLDPSFGTGGIATTSLGGNDDRAFDAALLPDGGFVAVGQADPAGLGNIDFGVVRYDRDGHPDPRFNGTGVETTDLTGHDDAARAVAVQSDGKIVAAGTAGTAETAGANFDFALVRYNPDGTLDKTFDGDGIVTTDLGTFNDDATDIAIQPDGKIVVVGVTDQNMVLARYLPDGKLDPTFNGTGTVVGITAGANGVAITPGGTILIAGTRGGPHGDSEAIVASYAPNGRINLGFGNLGVAEADISSGQDSGDDLALDSAGNIVLVGSASSATGSDMALARFKPDGTLDKTVTVDFHGTGDFGHALAIDPQGRIVAAGTSGDQFALMRANL